MTFVGTPRLSISYAQRRRKSCNPGCGRPASSARRSTSKRSEKRVNCSPLRVANSGDVARRFGRVRKYRRKALRALSPNRTERSLLPFALMICTSPVIRSTSPKFNLHNSVARAPLSSRQSSIALSRSLLLDLQASIIRSMCSMGIPAFGFTLAGSILTLSIGLRCSSSNSSQYQRKKALMGR